MIRTANQLKAKVRNLSGSDSQKAQTLIRNFIMERLRQAIKVDISTGDIIKDALAIPFANACDVSKADAIHFIL